MTDIANLIDEFFPTTKKKMEEIKNLYITHQQKMLLKLYKIKKYGYAK